MLAFDVAFFEFAFWRFGCLFGFYCLLTFSFADFGLILNVFVGCICA